MFALFPILLFTLVTAAPACEASNGTDTTVSHSWAGSNLYFLHALPSQQQSAYVSTLTSWGVKVLRLWVIGSNGGCVKGSYTTPLDNLEPSVVGTYNTSVLAALDNTLALLHTYGIKAIISPHDAGVINGSNGCDVYCTKYGNQPTFYNSTEASTDYDNRLATILNYESPNFGKPWSQLDEVILAFDIQNEPIINAIDLLEANDPNNWLCDRAGFLKSLISDNGTSSSGIKVATGGIGGSQYCCDHEFNLLDKALKCDSIDIMSVHGYMSKASDWAYFITGDASVLTQVNGTGKHVMIEEWGVASTSTDDFDTQVEVFNDAGIPWLYWQVIPGLDQTQTGAPSDCGYDGFEIGIDSTKGDVAAAVDAANSATAAQNWTGYDC